MADKWINTVYKSVSFIGALSFFVVIYALVIGIADLIGVSIPSPIQPEIERPIIGLVGVLSAIFIEIIVVRSISQSDLVHSKAITIPAAIWSSLINDSLDDLSIPEEKELQLQKEEYTEQFLRNVPSLITLTIAPAFFVYTYQSKVDLVIYPALLLIIGLIIGTSEDAFLNSVVRITDDRKRAFEARKRVKQQMQVFMFTLAICIQVGRSLGQSLGRIVATLFVSLILLTMFILVMNKDKHTGIE